MPLKAVFGFIISLVLVVGLIFSVDWSGVWAALQEMHFWPLIPATFLFIFQYLLRSLRWRLLLPEGTKVDTHFLFDSIQVGNLANFLLPLRAGEFIRPFLLTRYAKISFPSSLVSVIVERFFDLALVLGLFALVVFITPGVPKEVNIGAAALSSLAMGIFVVMVLGSFMEIRLLKIFDFIFRPLPIKIRVIARKFCKDFLDGAAVLKTPTRVFLVVAYTLGIWGLILVLNGLFFLLFGIQPTFEIALVTTVISALAVAAPSAPGFIGVYQWACIASFALLGLPTEKAVAFSIITHIYNFLAFILLGGYVLWRDGLKLADLKVGVSNENH